MQTIQDEIDKFSLLLKNVPLKDQDQLRHKLMSTMMLEYRGLLEKTYKLLGYEAIVRIEVEDIHKIV